MMDWVEAYYERQERLNETMKGVRCDRPHDAWSSCPGICEHCEFCTVIENN